MRCKYEAHFLHCSWTGADDPIPSEIQRSKLSGYLLSMQRILRHARMQAQICFKFEYLLFANQPSIL